MFHATVGTPKRLEYFVKDKDTSRSKTTSINRIRFKYSKRPKSQGTEGGENAVQNAFFFFQDAHIRKMKEELGENYR